MRKLIAAQDLKLLPINSQETIGLEVLRSNIVLLIDLARLVQTEFLVELLSLEHQRKRVSPVIREIALPDVDGVVRQIVVDDVRVVCDHIEQKHLPVVLQELFLTLDSTPAQFVLQVIHHAGVLHRDVLVLQSVVEIV